MSLVGAKQLAEQLKTYEPSENTVEIIEYTDAAFKVIATLWEEFSDGVDFGDFVPVFGLVDEIYTLASNSNEVSEYFAAGTPAIGIVTARFAQKLTSLTSLSEDQEDIDIDSIVAFIDVLLSTYESAVAAAKDGLTQDDLKYAPVVIQNVIALINQWRPAAEEFKALSQLEASIIAGYIAEGLVSILSND